MEHRLSIKGVMGNNIIKNLKFKSYLVPLILFYYKILKPVKKLYRFIFRPKTRGVKCILECNGEILLIKNTYGYKFWTFPGGGVHKNETLSEAVKREVNEEVGIKLDHIEFIGDFLATNQFKRDTVYCFTAKIKKKEFKTDEFEISEARWFSIKNLPILPPNTNRVFELYQKYK